MKSIYDIEESVIVITGAGGALPGTLAGALADQGARIALLDIDSEAIERVAEGIRADGGHAVPYPCNVLDEESLAEVRTDLIHRWGIPHGLINGAGGNHPDGTTDREYMEPGEAPGSSFLDLDMDGFRRVLELNLMGTVIPTQVFARPMAERGSGSIVNISSMSADRPLTKIPAYSAAKAGVSNFTRWAAVHMSRSNIRVNAISPGFFATEQSRFLQWDPVTGEPTERTRHILAATPMGRYGMPDELVGAVLWLLSESSCFVTGSIVPIDGGFSSHAI